MNNNSTKTFRRDRLLRLAQKGKLVMTESYHYDDMTGSDRSKAERPVRIIPEGDRDWWKNREEGCAYVWASDFDSSSGRCYQYEADGRIVLHVHSNCNYTFRIVD